MFNCARGKVEKLPFSIMKMFLLIKEDTFTACYPTEDEKRPFCDNPYFVIDPYERN